MARFILHVAMGTALAMLAAPAALADAPRACAQEELAASKPAPMPRDFSSIRDFTSREPRLVGFLIDVDAEGRTAVRCTIAVISHEDEIENAAEAVADFKMWPDDRTTPGAPLFIHIRSGRDFADIPSVLPRTTAPLCTETLPPLVSNYLAKPIYKPKFRWPAIAGRKDTGEFVVFAAVAPNGAVRLACRLTGDNADLFARAAYYGIAQIRFPADADRRPFYYRLTFRYGVE